MIHLFAKIFRPHYSFKREILREKFSKGIIGSKPAASACFELLPANLSDQANNEEMIQ
jgi:hypothetical protein